MGAMLQPEGQALLSAEQEYRKAFAEGLRPDEELTLSRWADRFRKLDQKSSPEPGDFRTSRTPYLREVMDNLSISSPVSETVVMKGAQLGFTEVGNNLVGYVIHHAPGPGLFLEPSEDLATRNVRSKINPMIAMTPELAMRVPKPRSGGNTMEEKEFPGGIWLFKYASSTAGLRSSTIRYLVMDEIDEWAVEVGEQGDPETLARKRTNAYGPRKKIYVPSTPTIQGRSKVEALYLDSDQRRYHMPCPCCQEMITFEFKSLKWPSGEPTLAWYECQRCGERIEEWQKTQMMEAGEWVPANPSNNRRRGYHISSLYSPFGWQSWGEIAQEWVEAQGNTAKMKAFVNTVLGETWKEKGEAPEWQRLYERRESYAVGVVPLGGLVLTAAADVQRGPGGGANGWIEVLVRAWGRNLENWVIDHQQFHGDTSDPSAPGGPWEQLEQLKDKHYPHEHAGVAMPISKLAVDSGDQTTTVYHWVADQNDPRVIATKGNDRGTMIGWATPIQVKANGQRAMRALKLWHTGNNLIKPELYAWLKYTKEPGQPLRRGYMHFPELSEEFFKQLTGEQMVVKMVKGRATMAWERIRPRVEVLDCAVYSRAAAYFLGIDGWTDEDWQVIETQLGIERQEEPGEAHEEIHEPERAQPARRKSNYWSRR